MTLPIGTPEYKLGAIPVTGSGRSYSDDELDSALSGPAAAVVWDESGNADIESLLTGLATTGFQEAKVKQILSARKPPKNWQVGEALAQTYLENHRHCHFPCPPGRDERKSGSSLPGADLVGFQSVCTDNIFAFGEVKTSSDKSYPPNTMYGPTGLNRQIGNLLDDVELRNQLVRYLGHRATRSSWESLYQQAATNYLQSDTNVTIFGFLIRDVRPDENDLKALVANFVRTQHADMTFDFLALYLPKHSIRHLSTKVVNSRPGGAV